MAFWEREPLSRIVNDEYCSFSVPGPLHSPIDSFRLWRTEKLALTLETKCTEDVTQGWLSEFGPLEGATQQAEIEHFSGARVKLTGVTPVSRQSRNDYRRGTSDLHETAQVFRVEADIPNSGSAAYTIDWLENVGRYFVWPELVVNNTDTVIKRAYGRKPDALALEDSDNEHSSGTGALRLTIGDNEFYFTTNSREEGSEQIKPGYILYLGTPDGQTRRKIRTVLSFALGTYLVHLGHSIYSMDWKLASFRAIGAYSMDMRAFDLHVLPPTWLGTTSDHVLSTEKVARLASALYEHYDELDFGNLSWGYWHAMSAPLHIKAVHFGAIIEALQRNYLAAHSSEFSERVISDSSKWGALVAEATAAIDKLEASTDQKAMLRANIGRLNQMPRATVTDQVLARIGLVLGEDEKQAWKRRHDAAHGNPMILGGERKVLRDSHLLRVIFNRMILRIVGGSDHYYDYTSRPEPTFPIRNLEEPVPDQVDVPK